MTQGKPIGSLKQGVVTLGPYVSPASGWPWETEGSSLIHISMISAKNNRLTQAGLNRNVSPHTTASPGDRVVGFSDVTENLVLPLSLSLWPSYSWLQYDCQKQHASTFIPHPHPTGEKEGKLSSRS